MQPQIILQALLLAVATAAPMPQRTSTFDLSGLSGSGSDSLASGFPLSSGGLGSGSGFDLSRLTNFFSDGGANTGSGTNFDLSKLRDFFGGDGSTGGLPTIPSVPSIPSTGGSTGGSNGGGFLGGSSTANDITSKKACKPNVLLFARGTTEGGNIGSSVGPSLNRELEKLAPGKFLFQGIDYQADIAGITALGRPGGQIAVRQIGEATTLCPDARIFLSGYSQGAMVMHNAVGSIPAQTKAKVGGIVTFGDPFQRQAFSGIDTSKVKIFCATGDQVCAGAFAITAAHLSYTSSGDTAKGAAFIAGLAA